MYQNMNDAAMINGISAGLNANDQTDMMQNQAIAQTNDTVNQLVGIVGDMMQGGMAMGGGMMPPMDQGMDPAMMGGQPPMDQGAMMPPPSAPMAGQVDNNGLGMKQGSYKGEESMSFEQDVINRTTQKLAALVKRANELDGSAEAIPTPGTEDANSVSFNPEKNYGPLKADTMDVPETSWFENLANSAPVSKLLDLAEATGVDRWADTANDFAGNIGTGLGNIVNSLDSSLNDSTNLDNLYDIASSRMGVDKAETDFDQLTDNDKWDAVNFAMQSPSFKRQPKPMGSNDLASALLSSSNNYTKLRNNLFKAYNQMGIPNNEIPSDTLSELQKIIDYANNYSQSRAL